MNTPNRRALLTAAVTAPVALASPVASAADAAILDAFAAWQAAREAARALYRPDDPSAAHDKLCDAAWVAESEAGERLARLTATTPNGAALQLRWLHTRLGEGILPNEAEALLGRLADTLATA
jgi:hypothetical protein